MEDRLKSILDSAIGLFNRYGIRSVTVDDICRELGMSKKTIYLYVSSKEDLVRAMLASRIQSIHEIFAGSTGPGMNAIDTLATFGKLMGDYLKNLKMNLSLDYDLKKYFPSVYREYMDQRNQIIHQRLAENIRQGIEQELYRAELNADLLADLFMIKMENLTEADSATEAAYSSKKMYKVMIENHIRGLVTKKGVKYFEKNILGK
ncbi:MAG TPA: TetR/AcrR family transcriptional regulator [Bacteroidales bacterium]|nr:TetR/AcrR family transcriptional regulator [Bacteroidales bacterium]HRZ21061.1 TetR/AcrR family transcriptional regulator [Bacteroidales bacterium]